MADVLIEGLVGLEAALTEDGVAEGCGLKRQMYRLAKKGRWHFSNQALGNILCNFPGLEAAVADYLRSLVRGTPGRDEREDLADAAASRDGPADVAA